MLKNQTHMDTKCKDYDCISLCSSTPSVRWCSWLGNKDIQHVKIPVLLSSKKVLVLEEQFTRPCPQTTSPCPR